MQLNVHLVFDGNCEAAFKLYELCLDAKITFLLTYGASPMADSHPDLKGKIAHATIKLANGTITGADVASASYEKPQGFALQLNLNSSEDAQQIFDTLSEGGTVHVPLQKTFWAELYASFTDRFGTPWEINGA